MRAPSKQHCIRRIEEGGSFAFWKRALGWLVQKGWPEYVIIWPDDNKMILFEKYLLQGVKNEIQRNRIR